MTSGDNNYVTIELFNEGIREIKTEINQRFDNLQAEIKDVKTEIRFTNSRIDNLAERLEDLKFFRTIGLTIIGVLIAIVALRRDRPETRPERSEDLSPHNIRDIRALIREEFSMLNSSSK